MPAVLLGFGLLQVGCAESTRDRDASNGPRPTEDAGPADVLTTADASITADGGTELDAGRTDSGAPDAGPAGTSGCGLAPADATGGVHVTHVFSRAAGGSRGFYLVLPPDYDPSAPHRLIVAYAGTNWLGEMVRPYFDFERGAPQGEIYVYPDPLWRDFPGWGNLGGWQLGPLAEPADGTEDIEFTRELLDLIQAQYCVDPDRVFATGHSWGGDMAAVVACFLGDRFTATAPAAANRPYWFEPAGQLSCSGRAAVWTFFGVNETHFTWQDHAGQFGEEQRDFWAAHHGCAPTTSDLGIGTGGVDDCIAFDGCEVPTRYCLYGPDSGHQIPSYFSAEVLDWFRSF